MNDGLKAYSFKSLDQLIDGDNFKLEFKEELKRLGFGGGENEVKYDTNQPYVKDFLINAYYEENFNKFEKTLEQDIIVIILVHVLKPGIGPVGLGNFDIIFLCPVG